MPTLPPDHPQRRILADEVHARPFDPVVTPTLAGYVAMLVPEEARAAEITHLGRLAQAYGVTPPAAGETLWRVALGGLRLKWERHGEFSGYLFLLPLAGPAGDDATGEPAKAEAGRSAWDPLPEGWLQRLPGQTLVAVRLAALRARGAGPPDPAELNAHFAGAPAAGARIAEGAGYAFSDFLLREDGCVRMLLVDAGMNPHQVGRTVQRLIEIEAYRMLALLALPIARRQAPRIGAIERALGQLTDAIARDDGQGEEKILQELTRLAAEVESGLAASHFRFGACRAYSDLVAARIDELRESRIEGLQTIAEFMSRRFSPAVATCMNAGQRLRDLSERVAQASSLLATRVGIAREKQNQLLLASMERRARQQLRLQQTVEGLSVAAILYYVVGLVAYVARGLEAVGLRVDAALVVLGAIPVAAAAVLWALRRARRRLRTVDA